MLLRHAATTWHNKPAVSSLPSCRVLGKVFAIQHCNFPAHMAVGRTNVMMLKFGSFATPLTLFPSVPSHSNHFFVNRSGLISGKVGHAHQLVDPRDLDIHKDSQVFTDEQGAKSPRSNTQFPGCYQLAMIQVLLPHL